MSKAQRKKRAREAKRPIGRMIDRPDLAGRIVNPCKLACFTCDRFLGHNRHACPGVKARPARHGEAERSRELPMCHVDFRTGRMESPVDVLTGKLHPGQEKFYETISSGPWPAESGCAWVAVKRINPPAVQGANRSGKPPALQGDSESGKNPPAAGHGTACGRARVPGAC